MGKHEPDKSRQPARPKASGEVRVREASGRSFRCPGAGGCGGWPLPEDGPFQSRGGAWDLPQREVGPGLGGKGGLDGESGHEVRVHSRARRCLRGRGRGGERGREWAAVGRTHRGEQQPAPSLATWLQRGPSFQFFFQKEAHNPSFSAKFLDPNLLATDSKVVEHSGG